MKKLLFLLVMSVLVLTAFGQRRRTHFVLTVPTGTDTTYIMTAYTNESIGLSFTYKRFDATDAVLDLGEVPHPDSSIFNRLDNSNLPYTLSGTTVAFEKSTLGMPYLAIKLTKGSVTAGTTMDLYVSCDRILQNLPDLSVRLKGYASATAQTLINLSGGSGGSSGAAGGGGALTGVATYSDVSGDFNVEAIDGTKMVYVTGAPYTVTTGHVLAGSAKVWNSVTNAVSDVTMTQIAVSGDTITFAGHSSNFTATDSVSLFLIMPTKSYDIPQDVTKSTVRNPDYAHYTDIETVFDETGLGSTNAYKVFYMASYELFSVHFNVSDSGYVRAFVTNNADASDTDYSSDWVDYSSTLFGSDSIGGDTGAEGMYFQDTPIMPLKLMFKAWSTDDTCAIDGWLRRYY